MLRNKRQKIKVTSIYIMWNEITPKTDLLKINITKMLGKIEWDHGQETLGIINGDWVCQNKYPTSINKYQHAVISSGFKSSVLILAGHNVNTWPLRSLLRSLITEDIVLPILLTIGSWKQVKNHWCHRLLIAVLLHVPRFGATWIP